MSVEYPPNVSIIRMSDGSAYGAHYRPDGTVAWCSENQAGLDPRGPIAWLTEHYPSDCEPAFTLVKDDGEAYRADLHASLMGTDDDLYKVRVRSLKAASRVAKEPELPEGVEVTVHVDEAVENYRRDLMRHAQHQAKLLLNAEKHGWSHDARTGGTSTRSHVSVRWRAAR